MKVKIKDLEANPFRDIKNYPIDQGKIESLAKSINQTGFWDNILARKNNGKIQIAYGHHRLVILKKEFNPDHIVDIPVKDLDDATMIRIMVNENMQEWDTTPTIIDEAVRVTYEYLKNQFCLGKINTHKRGAIATVFKELPIPTKMENDPENGYRMSPLAKQISNWLNGNWNEYRVYSSLERLKLISEGILDKEAVEKLPTEKSARHFTSTVKRLKDVTPEQQRRAAEKIIEHQDFGQQSVQEAIIEEKYPYEEKEKKEREFAGFIEECSRLINTLNRKLETLINFKSDFDSAYYKETFARFSFDASIDLLRVRLKQLLEEDK